MDRPSNRKRNRKKLQSAIEYITTYGWALLVILAVVVVLFRIGVFNPSNFASRAQAGSCQISRPGGPYSNYLISLQGTCGGAMPQYVALFNGQSSYVDAGNSGGLAISNALTIDVWIKTSVPQSNIGLITKGPITPNDYDYMLYFTGAGATPSFYMKDSNGVSNSISITGYNWADGAWHNFVGVFTGNAVLIYADGQTKNSITIGSTSIRMSTNTLKIGAGWSYYFNGLMSNVQIYNTSLSANEIQAQYIRGIGGAPIRPQNLVGWWPLNGDTKDYSGNGNSGTPTNIVYTTAWTSGYTVP